MLPQSVSTEMTSRLITIYRCRLVKGPDHNQKRDRQQIIQNTDRYEIINYVKLTKDNPRNCLNKIAGL